MRVGLISDTHGKLRSEVFERFAGVDLILHAGDIGSPSLITELEALAPVHAVHGNTDGFDVRALYGEKVEIDVAGKRVVVTHGHLLGSPTPSKLRLMHPAADVIVYGHTHVPLLDETQPIVVNPGSAGAARFKLKPSVAILLLPELHVTFLEVQAGVV